MVVEHQVVLGALLRYAVNHLCGLLVIAIKEVNFESFDAHGCIFFAGFVQLFVQYIEDGPENNVHLFLFGVADQFRQVDVRNDGEHVAALGLIPAFIKKDVFQSVLGCKIDVVTISVLIDARFEIDAADSPVVPPVPSNFARMNP